MASSSTSPDTASQQRPIYIVKLKGQPNRRSHMMIYIPNISSISHHLDGNQEGHPSPGTVLQVIGAPMLGYNHEFIHNYNINDRSKGVLTTLALVGMVEGKYFRDPPDAQIEKTDRAYDDVNGLEGLALKVAAPRKTENFLDPAQAVCRSRPLRKKGKTRLLLILI
jgi:hypothetical protein